MKIDIKHTEFEKGIATLEDLVFKSNIDNRNQEDLKLLKLLQAREQNTRFEYDIAEMICGEEGNSFPYRSSYYLTEFFRNLGYKFEHDGTTRRFWVEDVLKQLNIKEIADIIRRGLFNKRDFRNHAKKTNQDFEEIYAKAIQEFKSFIDDSISNNEELDLAFLLNMNINTDLLFNQESKTNDQELNDLIKESKSRFLNPKDKHIALEKIWDAFERIKTYYDTDKKKSAKILLGKISSEIKEDELEKEFANLTAIGNNYRIRHHEQGKIELKEESQIDYLYFRVLCLIDLCIRKINEYGD